MAETLKPSDPDNEDAPFGTNSDGSPLAPYGFKVNGKPRTTNRGRQAGSKNLSSGQHRKTSTRKTNQAEQDAQRKSALLQLSEMFIEMPLAAMSTSSMLAKKLGEQQTDALAGDALIWSHYAPSLADGLIAHSQRNPRTLAWMDGIQDKAPLLMIGQVAVQMTKAIVGNHMEPDPNIAKTGRRLARLNVAKMAAAINAEAEAMGIPTDDEVAESMRREQQDNNASDAA